MKKTEIEISTLSARAQLAAVQMDEDLPVFARRKGRGWELTQTLNVDLATREKAERELLADGWLMIDFTA